MLDIEKITEDKKIIYSLEGRLDTTTSPDLEKEVEALPEDIQELVFDFEKLDYISSAGLRVMLKAHKLMSAQGSLIIKNVQSDVMEVFEMTGFSDILRFE